MTTQTETKNENTLIWGAAAIAREINKPVRATFHLLERGHIPGAQKIGNQWTARLSKLRQIGG